MSQTKAQLISDLVQALNFTGTSSAPANGMYLSAANTIKLATNSNGRLTIDSSGNATFTAAVTAAELTISSTSPVISLTDTNNDSDFAIKVDSGAFNIRDTTNASNRLTIDSSGNSTFTGNATFNGNNITLSGDYPTIQLNDTDSESDYEIRNNNGELAFRDIDNNSNRLSIAAGGTVNVSSSFVVQGPNITIGEASSSSDHNINFTADTGTFTLKHNRGSHKLELSDSDGTGNILAIDTSGNVGIGTINPTKLLHLSGGSSPTLKISASDATPGIFIADADRTSQDQHLGEFQALWNGNLAGRIVVVAGPDTTNKDDGHMDFYTSNGGSNGHRMRIKHDGKVGIGTTNPLRKFHVEDSNSELALFKSTKATGSYINFKLGANGAELGMIGSGAEILSGGADAGDFGIRAVGDLCISSGGHAEKMRIDSSGRLLIGHTATTDVGGIEAALQVTGTTSDNSSLTLSRFSVDDWCSFLTFSKSRNGTIGNQTACTSNERLGQIFWVGSDGTDTANGCAEIVAKADGNFSSNNCPTKLEFGVNAGGTSSTTYLTIKPSGNVEINDGNVIIANGHGIDFSATAHTNADDSVLDDYERGGFNPTVAGSTTAGTLTYTHQSGYYVKIGKVVHCWVDITIASASGMSGIFVIQSLPYAKVFHDSQYSYYEGGTFWVVSEALCDEKPVCAGYMPNGYSWFYCYKGDDMGGKTSFVLNTTGRVSVYFVYTTAS